MHLEFDLYRAAIDRLIKRGWLRDVDRGNRKAVIAAFVHFATRALTFHIEPPSRVQ